MVFPNTLNDIKYAKILNARQHSGNLPADYFIAVDIVNFLAHTVKIFDFKIFPAGNSFINGDTAMHIFHKFPEFFFTLTQGILRIFAL